jgi:hypothetical protein
MTGPTYELKGKTEITGETIRYELLRTHVTTSDAVMKIPVSSQDISGRLKWRRFRSHDSWMTEVLRREGENLVVTIPRQPAAGKVIYSVFLFDGRGDRYDLSDEPVIIRFKGPVPRLILVPHVVFMFAAMFFATRTGLEALFRRSNSYRLAVWTSLLMFAGGLILGPVVQKYAFGEFWTGWPFGHDLTDTKTAFAMIFWLISLWKGRGPGKGRIWFVVAAIVTLMVYLIPHSALGSEFDYTSMTEGEA